MPIFKIHKLKLAIALSALLVGGCVSSSKYEVLSTSNQIDATVTAQTVSAIKVRKSEQTQARFDKQAVASILNIARAYDAIKGRSPSCRIKHDGADVFMTLVNMTYALCQLSK